MDRQRVLLATAAVLSGTRAVCIARRRKRGNATAKRTLWTRKWLQRRQGRGTLALLNSELRTEDPESYKNFLRLAPEQFAMLLSLVEKDIKKQDTFMRESISAEHKYDQSDIQISCVLIIYFL
nr:unnamed protein product [Callosobruchus analis]